VVQACNLERDLAVLPQGENTAIGERGINLSGLSVILNIYCIFTFNPFQGGQKVNNELLTSFTTIHFRI
jgi:hypothetical protein